MIFICDCNVFIKQGQDKPFGGNENVRNIIFSEAASTPRHRWRTRTRATAWPRERTTSLKRWSFRCRRRVKKNGSGGNLIKLFTAVSYDFSK